MWPKTEPLVQNEQILLQNFVGFNKTENDTTTTTTTTTYP